MKTLLLTYDYPPIISGIGTVLYEIWKRLPAGEHLILAPRMEGAQRYDAARPVIRYPAARNPLVRAVMLLFYAASIARREKVGCIVCAVPVSLGSAGWLLEKLTGIPYAVFYYGGEKAKYRRSFLLRVIRRVLMRAQAVYVNSRFTAAEALSYGLDPARVRLITPGVDTQRFVPAAYGAARVLPQLEGKRVLLTVGRMVRRKGMDAVIRVLPEILREFPDAVYAIVGSGPQENELKALAQQAGVVQQVIFAGNVPDAQLPSWYNSCDVFILLNRSTEGDETFEGFGTVFIEAAACAKPAIGGITGGVRDAVVDGMTGILIDPENPLMVRSAVSRLLKDAGLRRALGENGRVRAVAEFGWESRAQALRESLGEGAR